MNLPSILIILLIAAGIYYALRTLRNNDGHPCSSCHGGDSCPHCKQHHTPYPPSADDLQNK